MILNHCRLIPALSDGIGTESGSVSIEDGKINKISPQPVSAEEADFDCKGMTLLPGLIDLHTHITILGGVGTDCLEDPMKVLLAAQEQVRGYLDHGFTTIRDCGSYFRSAHYVRTAVERKLISGPDILSCGKAITSSSMGEKNMENLACNSFADGAAEVRRAVREEAVTLPDFIKIYASGSAYSPTGVPKHPTMTVEEILAAVETAEVNGLYAAAHCHADQAIRACVESGVRTVEHATYLSDETLELLSRRPDCYLVPTLAAMHVNKTDPAEREFWTNRLQPMLDSCTAAMEKAYRAGEKMGFGTDCIPGSPQYNQGIEFRMRKERCGMDDLDILLQATKYNAEIAGISHLVGTVCEGLRADLILVNGKPDQDISAMYHKPEHVWKNGELLTRM